MISASVKMSCKVLYTWLSLIVPCIYNFCIPVTLSDTRNIQFFGFDAQQKVSASYVVVIGLGGVGSHAASMLLRSGVGRLLLVDFDQVSYLYILRLVVSQARN